MISTSDIEITDEAELKIQKINDSQKRYRVKSLAISDAMSGYKIRHDPIVDADDIERCKGAVEMMY